MADDTTTRPRGWLPVEGDRPAAGGSLALAIAWSHEEPARAGEIAPVAPGRPCLVGRGPATADDPGARLLFRAQRPGAGEGRPLASAGLSRKQLLVRQQGRELAVERVGKAVLRVRGRATDRAVLAPGDALEVERELVLLCIEHESLGSGGSLPSFAFGEPDPYGFVGESRRVWILRDQLAAVASRAGHVLITGPSGAGKELAARAVHALSPRAGRAFVARNAATLPPGIIDAELFGNARNYPNAGMRERAGLLGESDGGTLFLDEIGELPDELQAHLLRVLDGGEYHRLGEDRARRADVRFVAATNRGRDALKHDFAARMPLGVAVPGLAERREDIPLLLRFLLRDKARSDPQIAGRFFDGDEPRVAPDLVLALLAHEYTGHVRELEALLLVALAESRDHYLALTPGIRGRVRTGAQRTDPPTREEIERALDAASGNVSRAFRDLGLPSRDALNRLMKKLGIVVRR